MLITHWRGAIIFYLQAVEPSCFRLSPPSRLEPGLRSPLHRQGGCGGHRPTLRAPFVPSAGSPGQSGCLQARSRLRHSRAHLRSDTEQRLGPHHPSRTGWDAGVPSCSVQSHGAAMLPWLDPDPLLVRTARGQGYCHGLAARWESGGSPAGPCPGAPVMLQLAALAVSGLFSP